MVKHSAKRAKIRSIFVFFVKMAQFIDEQKKQLKIPYRGIFSRGKLDYVSD